MGTAVYAGTFDPVTYGHLDVARRACEVFDRLIVATTTTVSKQPLFSLEERIGLLQRAILDPAFGCADKVEIASFSGLLVDFCRAVGARTIVRGLRAVSDFEYEFEIAMMNRSLAPDIETVFLVSSPEYMFVSSSLIKAVAASGGGVSQFVPPEAQDAIIRKLALGQPRP
jgi:pantetheine-phosphate adenylyltransferase